MIRPLGRSKSYRILMGGRKEADQQETDRATPQPTLPQHESRLKAAASVATSVGSVETPEMQRPKTSSGPPDRATQFHKKVTPINPTSGGNQDFEFCFTASPTKSSTVLYAAGVQEEREGIIGIALGSPTMASYPTLWHPSSRPTDWVADSQGTITQITSNGYSPSPDTAQQPYANQFEPAKSKLSRWKSLFKKTAPQRQAQEKDSFYQLAKSVAPARADSHHDDDSIVSPSRGHSDEIPNRTTPPLYSFNPQIRESRKLPKGIGEPEKDTRPRALTRVASPESMPKSSAEGKLTSPVESTMKSPVEGKPNSPAGNKLKSPVGSKIKSPIGNKSKSSLLRSIGSPQVPPTDSCKSSPTIPQVLVSGGSAQPSPRLQLLDVDIPTVKMERYSVMFSNVLKQDASKDSSNSSSLLQRRQGNSEKVKPLDALSTKEDQATVPKPTRRATSPCSSPARLSLFPSAHVSRAPSPLLPASLRARPLERSKTMPANSPRRENFAEPPAISVNVPSRHDRSPALETAGSDLTPHGRASMSSERSYDSDLDEIIIAPTSRDRRPVDLSPQWEIVSRPIANPVTKASALRSHPSTRQPSSAPLDQPTAERSPGISRSKSQTLHSPRFPGAGDGQATVGIARSVSVSRANKPSSLLKPMLISPGSGRFVEGKPLTPTLVELSNRKSHIVQLVDA